MTLEIYQNMFQQQETYPNKIPSVPSCFTNVTDDNK